MNNERHLIHVGSVSDRYIHSFRKCRHQPKITQPGSVPPRHGGFLQLPEMSPEVTVKSHRWAFPADSPARCRALPAAIKRVYNAFIPLGKHLFHPLVQGSRARAWAVLSQPHLVIPLQRRLTSSPHFVVHTRHWPCLVSLQTFPHFHLEILSHCLSLVLPTVSGFQRVLFSS